MGKLPATNILSLSLLLVGLALYLMFEVIRRRRATQILSRQLRLEIAITEQMAANKALAGQLIAAQERERGHIARKLHDDVCQRLAMLSLRVERVAKEWTDDHGTASIGHRLQQIWQQCSALAGDVQAMSHALHPSLLDNLGLVATLRSFCRDFSIESGAVIELSAANIPDELPRGVALSIFRVVQEGLHNAEKYSGASRFEVNLRGLSDVLELEVRDRGIGFDIDSKRSKDGLGLVSMRERIHLLNGTMTIETEIDIGTTIRATVPILSVKRFNLTN